MLLAHLVGGAMGALHRAHRLGAPPGEAGTIVEAHFIGMPVLAQAAA